MRNMALMLKSFYFVCGYLRMKKNFTFTRLFNSNSCTFQSLLTKSVFSRMAKSLPLIFLFASLAILVYAPPPNRQAAQNADQSTHAPNQQGAGGQEHQQQQEQEAKPVSTFNSLLTLCSVFSSTNLPTLSIWSK